MALYTETLGIIVIDIYWVMQDFHHQQYVSLAPEYPNTRYLGARVSGSVSKGYRTLGLQIARSRYD